MDLKRLRGLRALIGDAVEHGATGVQKVHLELAARPFAILEAIPPIATPARDVHTVYRAWVSGVYGAVRLGNRAVGAVADVALDVAEARGKVEGS